MTLPPPPPPDKPRGNILVVDDEPSIRFTLKRLLERVGYRVETAENANQAQHHLEGNPFDIVLSDIVMPGLSGIELLKMIRKMAPQVQVIIMTGEPTAETAAEARQAGASDYLLKPVSMEMILQALEKAMLARTQA